MTASPTATRPAPMASPQADIPDPHTRRAVQARLLEFIQRFTVKNLRIRVPRLQIQLVGLRVQRNPFRHSGVGQSCRHHHSRQYAPHLQSMGRNIRASECYAVILRLWLESEGGADERT